MTKDLRFKFGNLEITSIQLILHFYNEEILVALKDIKNYRLEWHLPRSLSKSSIISMKSANRGVILNASFPMRSMRR